MDPPLLQAVSNHPSSFLNHRFVYPVISQRAGGMSIGINMSPNQACHFDCVYCQVKRSPVHQKKRMDVGLMSEELQNIFDLLQLGFFPEFPNFQKVPANFLSLKDVALSGDGEPTLCPVFYEVVQEIVRLRKEVLYPPFKLVLITNSMGLNRLSVQKGLDLFSEDDEVWAKLDVGTQAHLEKINGKRGSLKFILSNIKNLGRWRSIIIQSLFCRLGGEGPTDAEVDAYIKRLTELKNEGCQIKKVQVYSVVREPSRLNCTPLPIEYLETIARMIRETAGLKAEAFHPALLEAEGGEH